MTLSRSDVEHVARLARLNLTEDEKDMFVAQLSKILDHAAVVTALETEGVEPTSHPLPLSNVFRPDEPTDSLSQDEATAAAPEAEDGYFKVPKILD
jgi:aspartyl-tRNA(Asn)/glutamyl-tRNA(Gln) amidotransferase subunit C